MTEVQRGRIGNFLLNGIVGIITTLALFLGGQRVWQSIAGQGGGTTTIHDWRRYGDVGQRLGPYSARVVIVWFGDYQCSWCRIAAVDLENLRRKYPGELATVFRHFPLSNHPEAMEAAIAAECAGVQGHFQSLHRLLFSRAESLGTEPWHALASDAGVGSLDDFQNCMTKKETEGVVVRDLAAASALGLAGTPGFLINDQLVPGYPGAAGLERFIIDAVQE